MQYLTPEQIQALEQVSKILTEAKLKSDHLIGFEEFKSYQDGDEMFIDAVRFGATEMYDHLYDLINEDTVNNTLRALARHHFPDTDWDKIISEAEE